MNLEAVTIQDCLDMQRRKGMDTILVASHVMGFEKEIGSDKELVQTKRFPVEVEASAGRDTNE